MNAWTTRLIELARAGDDEAARALVAWLAECLREGTIPPADLAAYFAQAFEQIVAGHRAADALNLGKQDLSGRDYEIARAVWMLIHRAVDPLRLKSNRATKRGACDVVAEQFGMGAYNVEAIYKRLRPLVEAEFLEGSPSAEAKAKRHAEIQQCVVFGKFAEQLKKQGRK